MISKVLLGVSVAAGAGAAGLYFYTKDQIETLTRNNTILEQSVQQQKDVIAQMQEYSQRIQEESINLSKKLVDAERRNDRLQLVFKKHDLTNLSDKKPKLVEKRVNDATNKLFDDFESITRKP